MITTIGGRGFHATSGALETISFVAFSVDITREEYHKNRNKTTAIFNIFLMKNRFPYWPWRFACKKNWLPKKPAGRPSNLGETIRGYNRRDAACDVDEFHGNRDAILGVQYAPKCSEKIVDIPFNWKRIWIAAE